MPGKDGGRWGECCAADGGERARAVGVTDGAKVTPARTSTIESGL